MISRFCCSLSDKRDLAISASKKTFLATQSVTIFCPFTSLLNNRWPLIGQGSGRCKTRRRRTHSILLGFPLSIACLQQTQRREEPKHLCFCNELPLARVYLKRKEKERVAKRRGGKVFKVQTYSDKVVLK